MDVGGQMPGTWHYGLIADWWAQFNTDGPEIEYFGRFVRAGQPALDAGCGAGRLLLPWLRAGYDVDGCDVSVDMVQRCRYKTDREGLHTTMLVQALHEMAPARHYRTIVACGVFGLGSTLDQDLVALERMYDALEPGGTLLIDHEVPYGSQQRWTIWSGEERARLPEPWPDQCTRRIAHDGSVFELRSRALAFDPLDQSLTLQIHAERHLAGTLVASEEHKISIRMYFHNELVRMLVAAGFVDVTVRGDYTDELASPEHEFLVYIARRPESDGARRGIEQGMTPAS